eukprot:TRINITY_DN2843_c0_g1_i1.p1 TRINITY_DN2843_c0_g1~~TRINITY_DN2843_c0_g1_i1.p1  ORF type:complete len:363 (-),score=53.03 TRINITY_DN2843_c0_g1_i1:57-1145(-)
MKTSASSRNSPTLGDYATLEEDHDNHTTISVPADDSSMSTEKPKAKEETTKSFYIFVILFYSTMSTSAIFVNKEVVTEWDFNFPLTMILFQMIWSLVCLLVLKNLGVIQFEDLEWNLVKTCLPMSVTFLLNGITGLSAMHFMSLPMFVTLRRCASVVILVAAYFVDGIVEPLGVQITVYMMIVGTLVAGFYDLQFNLIGYAYAMGSNLMTALQLVLTKKLNAKHNFSPFGMLYYNNILALPWMMLIWLLSSEPDRIVEFDALWNPIFLLTFCLSCGQIFLLNYANFLLTATTSGLTTGIIGSMKNIVSTFGGYILFSDASMNMMNFTGVSIGVVASLAYTVIKLRDTKKKAEDVPVPSMIKK